MIIRQLNIKNFGKIHDKTLEFSPGINVLYGENESGKTTIHTFIKSMFFGLTRMRGKAARNDTYSTYEPWENPGQYGRFGSTAKVITIVCPEIFRKIMHSVNY